MTTKEYPRIIGVAGPARSGKDTVAEYIKSKLPNYVVMSFAAPLKTMLSIGLNLKYAQLYGDQKEVVDERYGQTPRYIMQTLGTEWGRNLIDPDIWPKVLMAHAQSSKLIIPDVRFENEARMVRSKGVILHIKGRGGVEGDHASEGGIKPLRHERIIPNDGTLADLYAYLDQLVILFRD